MAPDAPTPEPSAAEVIRAALPEVYDDMGHALPYDGGTERILARLDAAGYEIVRKTPETVDVTALKSFIRNLISSGKPYTIQSRRQRGTLELLDEMRTVWVWGGDRGGYGDPTWLTDEEVEIWESVND